MTSQVQARQRASLTSRTTQQQQHDHSAGNTEPAAGNRFTMIGSNNKLAGSPAGSAMGAKIANFASADFKPIQAIDTSPFEQTAPLVADEGTDSRSSISDFDADERAPAGKENTLQQQQRVELDDKAHHVGPVMGIFFKVWSLVKVTRGRHQKMRRQNVNDDTGQFQYISGDLLPGGTGGVSRLPPSTYLEDRHFRRAGSQPAPSCSGARPALDPLILNPTGACAGGRLQVLASTASTCSSTAGTSSSGVSSSTSSTLANQNNCPAAGVSSVVRRHLSAHSLRKPLSGALGTLAGNQQQQQLVSRPKPLKSAAGWASKIKRSATSVNQADGSSYNSRFSFVSQRSQLQPTAAKVTTPTPAPAQLVAATRTRYDEPSRERHPQEEFQVESGDLSSEEDSNDIYSTPNDSIQSVPNSARGPFAADNDKTQLATAAAAAASAGHFYPIIKSFSTTNFSQLAKQQERFRPIGELLTCAGAGKSSDLKRHDSERSGASQEEENNCNANKRLSGSRFFISSSSSEDSNPPSQRQHQMLQSQHLQQQQHHHQHHHQNTQQVQDSSSQQQSQRLIEQCHQQVSLRHDVHYHAPNGVQQKQRFAASRPNSLLMGGAGQFGQLPATFASSILVTPVSMKSPLDGGAVGGVVRPLPALAPPTSYLRSAHCRRSPSLFDISQSQQQSAATPTSSRLVGSRFSSKYPFQSAAIIQPAKTSHQATTFARPAAGAFTTSATPPLGDARPSNGRGPVVNGHLPNSISLHDCKLSNSNFHHLSRPQSRQLAIKSNNTEHRTAAEIGLVSQFQETLAAATAANENSEYKLAQMLVEFGSNPGARDASGYTVLMQAILSDNLPSIKCLIERGVDLNETNHAGLGALDLVCSRQATAARVEILKLLIDSRANLDLTREFDGTRLLDRVIAQHETCFQDPSSQIGNNKLPFIDCLLQGGAKLGSTTWLAANGKHEVQLRLLKKLCQDGYFLYKKSSIEAAVYRFEYALKRIAELEQQLTQLAYKHSMMNNSFGDHQLTSIAARQIKYQTYLGLSRCERKRRFYKRALEFAHLAILVDSTSYEGYYSKAHILKDLGEIDDSLIAIDQTSRLVEKSIEGIQIELKDLQQQEEALIYDGCFNLLLNSRRSSWIETTKIELNGNLDYLQEAKKYISKLRSEILDDKLGISKLATANSNNGSNQTFFPDTNTTAANNTINTNSIKAIESI